MEFGPNVIWGENIHASCVCHSGLGLLILGPSGAGKSTLALQMIALGASLVADDRCEISADHGQVFARAPAPLQGMIEARGLGILRLPFAPMIRLVAAVDLGQRAQAAPRLPDLRQMTIANVKIDFLHFQPGAHFPSLMMCYLISQGSK